MNTFKIDKGIVKPSVRSGETQTRQDLGLVAGDCQPDLTQAINPGLAGSNPAYGTNEPIAQPVEHETFNLVADGSIPSGLTKRRGRPPGSKNKAKSCRSNADHVWQDSHQGEQCIKCSTKIPCDERCVHYECLTARDLPLPDWYVVNDAKPCETPVTYAPELEEIH